MNSSISIEKGFYSKLYTSSNEEKVSFFKHLDLINHLEETLLPSFAGLEFTGVIAYEKLDDIYLAAILIKYKNDLRTNIFEKINKSFKNEFLFILNNIIAAYNDEKTNMIQKEISLDFLIMLYYQLDIDFINKQLIKFTSIFLWVNLNKEYLIQLLQIDTSLIKKFSAVGKLNEMEKGKTLTSLPCTFYNRMIDEVLEEIESNYKEKNMNYYIKALILFTDIISVPVFRKYFLPLLNKKHFIERINLLEQPKTNETFQKTYSSLKFYFFFEIANSNRNKYLSLSYEEMTKMQSIAYSLFPEELTKILSENISFVDTRQNLKNIIVSLSLDQQITFLSKLNLLKYPDEFYLNRQDLVCEIFITKYERKENIYHKILSLPLYPNEEFLYNETYFPEDFSIVENKVLPIPKVQLNYLNLYDYLLKNYLLYKFESAFEIKNDIEDVIERMHPNFDYNLTSKVKFEGWSIMGIPIKNYQIISVSQPLVGEEYPNEVTAEIEYNLNGVQNEIKHEWDELRRYDVIFFLSFTENSKYIIRAGEIVSIYDEDNKNILSNEIYNSNGDKNIPIGFNRRVLIKLDPVQYTDDLNKGKVNIKFDLLIRRKPKENNFKSILQSIKSIIKQVETLPLWIQEPILGRSVSKENKKGKPFDYYDTFISSEHLKEYQKENKIKGKIKCNLLSNKPIKNEIKFTPNQIEALTQSMKENNLSLIIGPPGTGKTDMAVQLANLLYHNEPEERIIILTHSNNALNDIFEKIVKLDIDKKYLLRLGMGSKEVASTDNFSINGRVNYMLLRRQELLNNVLELAHKNDIYIFEEYTCSTALLMIEKFLLKSKEEIKAKFSVNLDDLIEELKEVQIFELLRDQSERRNHLIKQQCKIIAMTCTYASLNREYFHKINFTYSTVILEESAQILDIESFIPLTLQRDPSKLKRFVMFGDPNQLPPIVKSTVYKSYSNFDTSLFERLIKNGHPSITLNRQGRTRSEIVNLYRWRYEKLLDMDYIKDFPNSNNGFLYTYQFIDVEDYDDQGEVLNDDYSFFNLAEAEYSIGIYMYMCLIGYKPSQISIITAYNGQKELIKEIYEKKCIWNDTFKGINKITTIDKYQGMQNDYVIVSLVRTKNIGYLRDIRRFIVTLSRAKYGLYILGRWNLFNSCSELKEIFEIINKEDHTKLKILLNKEEISVDDFKHIYRIVQEMIKIKLEIF